MQTDGPRFEADLFALFCNGQRTPEIERRVCAAQRMLTELETTPGLWMPLMPPLPLEQGVPVLDPSDGEEGVAWGPHDVQMEGGLRLRRDATDPLEQAAWARLRVNLGKRQGFAHALQWLIETCEQRELCLQELPGSPNVMRWVGSWLWATITDPERVSLAHACAGVAVLHG